MMYLKLRWLLTEAFHTVASGLILGLVITLPMSFISALASTGETCKTYSYYLPTTFLICNLIQERK